MKVLLLTQWYPPEPLKLYGELAQSLQEMGHDVTVVTAFPNFPHGKIYPGYKMRPWKREVADGVRVIRVPLYPDHSHSPAKRAFNFMSFALSSAIIGAVLVRRPDIIYTIPPPPTALPAWLLSMRWRVPFAYEIQDMWPETLQSTGMVSSPKVLGQVGRFCNWIYRRAESIRVISEGFKANLIEKGVPEEKIRVISNWVDTSFYHPTEPEPELAGKLGFEGRFNVMYAGTIGLAQGLDTVLEAACLLRDEPDIQLMFVGDGVELPRLKEEAEQRGINNVRFLGRFPGSEMSRLYALADVLLVYLRDDPLFRMTIPHKTFAYLSSGKPVLAAVEGDTADVVRGANAGLACPPGDPARLAETIREFYRMPAAQRAAMGANGREAACRRYSRENLVPQVGELLEGVMARKREKLRVRRGKVASERTK